MQARAAIPERTRVVVPLERLDRAALTALSYALAISTDVTAVHVASNGVATKRIRERWRRVHDGVRLEVLEPSGTARDRIASYLDDRARVERDAHLTVVIPTTAARPRFLYPLWNWGALRLARRLARMPGTAVVTIPYLV